MSRIFIRRHLRLAPCDKFVFGQSFARLQNYERLDLFTEPLVSHPEYGNERNRGMRHDDLFKLAGINVVTPAKDHVLLPIDNSQISILVDDPYVASMKPSVPKCLCSSIGPFVITLHDKVAADHHLSPFTSRHFLIVFVNAPDLNTEKRLPHRPRLRRLLKLVERRDR